MIDLVLPIKTVAGLNAREHWRARSRRVKNERMVALHETRWALEQWAKDRSKLGRDPRPCTVTLIRMSSGTLDDDNLQGAAKAIRDGIADAIGVPDNDPLIRWQYAQERCNRGEYGMRVRIEKTIDDDETRRKAA